MDRMRLDLKTRTAGTKGASNLRVKQAEKRALARSNARSNAFAKSRKMDTSIPIDMDEDKESKEGLPNTEKPNTMDARRIRLEKWKQDKLQKEAYLKSKQKPIFKTGVVHHSVGSPSVFGVPSFVAVPSIKTSDVKNNSQPRNGATTRAMRTNILKAQAPQLPKPVTVKAISRNNKFKAPSGVKAISMLTIPTTPKGMSERKLQAKPHTNCPPSKVGRSLAFPAAPVQPKKTNVNPLPFLPKTATPNVRAAAKVNCILKPTATPNAGLPKKVTIFDSKPKTTPHVSRKVTVLTPGLAPIIDELPPTPQETVVDPKVSSSLPVVAKKPESPILAFKDSPYVTLKRGNYSDRRKSVKSKLADTGTSTPLVISIGSLSVDDERTTTEDGSQHPAIHYRNILGAEINRLNDLCKEWTTLRSEIATKLSENVNSLVDLAVGQTQLLIRSKFEQFRGLTYDCEKGECTPPVTTEDLQGFWEMVYIQVENVDKQFRHLADLKGNDFVEKSPTKAVVTKKRNAKKPSKPAAPARDPFKSFGIRALIEAQRQKQLQEVAKPEGGSERRSATPGRSSARRSMLRTVLKSSTHLSPIIMRVSQIVKQVGSPTTSAPSAADGPRRNQPQTPYRGILKDVSMVDSIVRERRKTVNFGESTIKNLTPDFGAFDSPAVEPPAYSAMHVEDSHVELQTDEGQCVTPPRLPSVSAEQRSTSLKRRTRGSHRKTYDGDETSDVNKENCAAKNVLTNGTPVDCTPKSDRPRRSYRKTPYKKTDSKAKKPAKVLAEESSDSTTTDDTYGTPLLKSWHLSRKSPYKEITNQSKSC